MTPKQQVCYNFIKKYWAEHGMAPSYDEIAKHIGVKHRSTVNRLVCAMTARGILHHDKGLTRSVRPASMEWPPA